METRPDILHRLKEHSIPPPAEVAEKARRIPMEEYPIVFGHLREHATPPPARLRSIIIGKTTGFLTGNSTAFVLTRLRAFLPYIAAGLIVLVVGIFLFRHSSGTATVEVKHKAAVPAAPGYPGNENRRGAAGDPSLLAETPAAATPDSGATKTPIPLAITLGGQQYPLENNSLLATFASYRYPALLKELHNENGTLRIRLDQYTNISLSPVMVATLGDLFDTRIDGSPSRKAKRTREKLDRWQQQDKKQFDGPYFCNPLDAVDLAEFIYPAFFSFHRHTRETRPAFSNSSPPVSKIPDSGMTTARASLTISYTLSFSNAGANAGLGEAYNGGIQTLFDAGTRIRLRLASLMRIQSIFMTGQTVTLLTESGKPQSNLVLSAAQWSHYNAKYAGQTCNLTGDTVHILGYTCAKASIRLRDGRNITAWYTPKLREPAQAAIEPAFASIPGLVLRYEYTCRRKTLRYTATSLSRQPIDPSVFIIPAP